MSPEERVEARRSEGLRRANEVRAYRAELKRDLATDKVKLSEILRSGEGKLATMRIRDLLLAVPGIGPRKAQLVLTAEKISPSLPLERLTKPRREQLLARLRNASYNGAVKERI